MRTAVSLLLLGALAACSRQEPAAFAGDARLGKKTIEHFDCGVCHRIPGIRDARGRVGPSLDRYGQRVYVAGKVPNTAAHLIRWIQHPASLTPGTAMPDLDVSETEARNIAAYLYGLK